MNEIYQLLNESITYHDSIIKCDSNAQHLGATIKPYHRIFYFEATTSETHYIDFVPYKMEGNIFYIVPAGHLYYLPYTAVSYHCKAISKEHLTLLQQQILFKFKYIGNKSVKVAPQNFEQIIHAPLGMDIASIFAIVYTKQNIVAVSPYYHEKAQALILFFAQNVGAHHLSVSELAKHLCLSAKTLLRLCNEVFAQTPKFMLRYHLHVLSITYILYFPAKSFAEIAASLGFKETSTFNRYIKSVTGQSPSEIRYHYVHLLMP